MNFLHNILLALIYGVHQLDSVQGENEPFNVLTNAVEVEKLLLAYAPIQHSYTKRIMSSLTKKTNICNSSADVKISFCQRILRIDYHGFEFDLQNYNNPECTDTVFVIQFNGVDFSKIKYNSLNMFKCPPIKFTDLRTGKNDVMNFKHVIFVSRGKHRDSAFVFIQKEVLSAVCAFLFVSNIQFDKLTRYNEDELKSLTQENFNAEMRIGLVEARVLSFLRNKYITAPYQKFIRLRESLGVCGLRQSQKIHFCRLAIQSLLGVNWDLDIFDYDEHRCRKHRLHIETQPKGKAKKRYGLSVVRCPPIASLNVDARQTMKNPTSYYLSTNLTPASVTLFFRHNQQTQPLHAVRILDGLNMLRIAQDNRRAQFAVYPRADERTTIGYGISLGSVARELHASLPNAATVQMPATIARPENYNRPQIEALSKNVGRLEMRRNRWLVDDIAILFSEMKRVKLVYRKFGIFHWSLDVCQLSTIQRRNLCYNAVKMYGLPGQMVLASGEAINYPCQRRQISLSSRDAENLESDMFWLWPCPQPGSTKKPAFYIGKSNLSDAILVYRRYSEDAMYFLSGAVVVDALASNINRYLLALARAPLSM